MPSAIASIAISGLELASHSEIRAEKCLLEDTNVAHGKVLRLAMGDAYEPQLVAVMSLRRPGASSQPDKAIVSQVRRALLQKLPVGEVPKRWVLMEDIPLTESGKVDVARLRQNLLGEQEQGTNGAAPTVGEMDGSTGRAWTEMEKTLRRIVGVVLELPEADIGFEQSFVTLGGDSIGAIEVMACCMAEDVRIEVPDIMCGESLKQLASGAKYMSESEEHDHLVGRASEDGAQQMKPRNLPRSDATKDAKNEFPLLSLPESGRHIFKTVNLANLGIFDYSKLESAYPCSPVQEGMLLSQVKSPQTYRIERIFEVTHREPNEQVDVEQVQEAWQAVVNFHPALRTIFVSSARETGMFDQIVLHEAKARVRKMQRSGDAMAVVAALNELQPIAFQETRPAHHLTICKGSHGLTFCKFEISHAIIDGMSTAVLFRDFSLAYSGCLHRERGPLFSDFITYIRTRPKESALQYWTSYLRGVGPCHFPPLNAGHQQPALQKSVSIDVGKVSVLQNFCKEQGVTLATLFQAVWGIILRCYTQSDTICFGFLSSGRDGPVLNVQSMIGVLIHMLVCRIDFSGSPSFKDIIKRMQAELSRGLTNQHSSLADIQSSLDLDGQTLFNTLISIEYGPRKKHLTQQGDLIFKTMREFASTEVSRTRTEVIQVSLLT